LGNGGKPTGDTLKCFGTVRRLAILVTHKQFTAKSKQGKANQKQDNLSFTKRVQHSTNWHERITKRGEKQQMETAEGG